MGDGYTVDPHAVMGTARSLGKIQKQAAEIMELAAGANPDRCIWGALGDAILRPAYWPQAKNVYQHLETMGRTLKDHADALDATGKCYLKNDEAIARALKSIREELS